MKFGKRAVPDVHGSLDCPRAMGLRGVHEHTARQEEALLFGSAVGPVVLTSMAFAVDLPDVLGGYKAYTPAFYSTDIFVISILIGLCAGLITGCIGAGGGFIITPALMSAGVKGILAVGTDLFHIFAKAIMGTAIHRKLGNVSVALAVAFLVGSGIGVTGGGFINRALYEYNPVVSDAVHQRGLRDPVGFPRLLLSDLIFSR